MSRITLYGFYNYDPTLFDDIILPETINKETLIAEIISRSGDLYPYYQVPTRLKDNINFWFMRRRYDFQMMHEALTSEYSPIENYDRKEDFNRNFVNSGNDQTNRQYSNTGRSDERGSSAESVSAFNSSSYEPRNKVDSTNGNSTSSTSTDTSRVDYGAVRNETEHNRVHGNIGVTTAQQMIEAELTMREKFDLYSMIASLFEREFLIQLY